ncbi:retinol dehydrogenase 12 [Diplocarpon rosae]|nr:retinol dehydrogenase 12 [Diplocarpon rosae]
MAGVIQTVKNTIAENLGGASHSLATKDTQFSLAEVPDQSNKVAVITAGSRGIGYACAHTLLERNISKLFIIASTQESLDGASSHISSTLGQSTVSKVKFLQADLADWKSLPSIAKQITDSTDRIDLLINDAARGIMTYQQTSYGVDRHMAVCHVGHVILTSHLLPRIRETAKSNSGDKVRLVMLGSNAHQATPSDCKFASLDELNQDLGPNGQYGRAKLAQMLQWEGAVSAMFCATKTEEGGQYVCPPAIPEAGSKLYQDEEGELERNLMDLTIRLVREKMDPEKQGCPLKLY